MGDPTPNSYGNDVFLSYSRKDANLVGKMSNALQAAGLKVWLDKEDIPYSAEWWLEIERGIIGANTFVFIISPHSFESEICQREFAFAQRNHKRIIPIQYQEITKAHIEARSSWGAWSYSDKEKVSQKDNWDQTRKLNWVLFEEEDFETSIQKVLQAVRLSPSHLQQHTRLMSLARDWQENDRNPARLVRGSVLKDAEKWLIENAHADPEPTELHRAYIQASVVNRKRRRIWTNIITTLLLVIIGAVGIAAYLVFGVSEESKQRQTSTFAEDLSNQGVKLTSERYDLALLLGLESYQILQSNNLPTDVAERNLKTMLEEQNEYLVRYLSVEALGWTDAVFTPDGRQLIVADNEGKLSRWDMQTFQLVAQSGVAQTDGITKLRIHPDGDLLVTISQLHEQTGGVTIQFWDAQTLAPMGDPIESGVESMLLASVINNVAFTPDGRFMATVGCNRPIVDVGGCPQGELDFWDAAVRPPVKVAQKIEGHPNEIVRLAFSPDGQWLATASCNEGDYSLIGYCLGGEIWLWDMTTLERVHNPIVVEGRVNFLTVQDGQITYGGHIGESERGFWGAWSITEWEPVYQETTDFPIFSGGVVGTTIITAGGSGNLVLWQEGNPITLNAGQSVNSIALHENQLVSISPSRIMLWNVAGGQGFTQTLTKNLTRVVGVNFANGEWVAIDADGRQIQGSTDGQIWQEVSHDANLSLNSPVVFSADGQWSAEISGDFKTITIREIQTGEIVSTLENPFSFGSAAFSPDQRSLATGTLDRKVLLWEIATGFKYKTLDQHENIVSALAFDPSGERLASGSWDYTILVWSLKQNQDPVELQGHTGNITTLAFSPDGQWLVSGSNDKTVKLWNLATGQATDLPIPSQPLPSITAMVAFSPDGTKLAAGDVNGNLLVWDLTQSSHPYQAFVLPKITSLAFSADGESVIVGTDDGAVMVQRVTVDSWLMYACQLVNRDLTAEELKRFNIGDLVEPTCPPEEVEKN